MRRLLACVVASVVLLAGCTAAPDDPPGEARIDVDTPSLRHAKTAAGVADCPRRHGRAVDADGTLPQIVLPCFGGGRDVALGYLRGPLVVNVWASWCGPCREEMPVLEEFHERYGDRVPILGINYEDTQPDAAMQLVRDTGVTYPLLADPQADLQGESPFPGRMGLPLFAFVDADGQATVVGGGVGSLAEMKAMVEDELGVTL